MGTHLPTDCTSLKDVDLSDETSRKVAEAGIWRRSEIPNEIEELHEAWRNFWQFINKLYFYGKLEKPEEIPVEATRHLGVMLDDVSSLQEDAG